jgi:hypothetical protein
MAPENAIMLGFVRWLQEQCDEEERKLEEQRERRWTQEDEYFNKH